MHQVPNVLVILLWNRQKTQKILLVAEGIESYEVSQLQVFGQEAHAVTNELSSLLVMQ